jgi:Lon protease-like protein
MEGPAELPLFPLHTVLFPGGSLALRVFEARYIDMVRSCFREDAPFGVVLIKDGSEVGSAETFGIGTLADITDWGIDEDGLLGINVRGRVRFSLSSSFRDDSGIYRGLARPLPSEGFVPLAAEFVTLCDISPQSGDSSPRTDRCDAESLSYRLAERLPLSLAFRQKLLECDRAYDRLTIIRRLLESDGRNGSASH